MTPHCFGGPIINRQSRYHKTDMSHRVACLLSAWTVLRMLGMLFCDGGRQLRDLSEASGASVTDLVGSLSWVQNGMADSFSVEPGRH